MKKLLAIAILFLMATPALGKTQCQSSPSKASSSHYRLLDGKKCWYTGARMAKANLTWEKSNVRPALVQSRPAVVSDNQGLMADSGDIPNQRLVALPQQLTAAVAVTLETVMQAALDQQATDWAISALCGEVKWGVCNAQVP